jgi:hypothetical protein
MNKDSRPELAFVPRIINPVRMNHAVIFAADPRLREAGGVITRNMPWVSIRTMSNPVAVAEYRAPGPTVFIMDDTALAITDTGLLHETNEDAVITLLSTNRFIQCSPPGPARVKYPYTAKADLVFAVNATDFAPSSVITCVVRAAEDLLNIGKYAQAKAYIFLIVDDEPRWFSQFLPLLYDIIGQRAAVMITRTYEETLEFIFGVQDEAEIAVTDYKSMGHGDDVVCLITDIFFPKGDQPGPDAGRDLMRLVGRYYPRYPVIVASKAKEAGEFQDQAFVLQKGDPGSLDQLRAYILDHTGMGDFLICDDDGRELYRIKDISEMRELLDDAESGSMEAERLVRLLEAHGQNDRFSAWLYMHSYRYLADTLRPMRSTGRDLVSTLRQHLDDEVRRLRRTPLVIDGVKAFSLEDLRRLVRSADPEKIERFAANDTFSSWLDRQGYPELADELRPIHGSGQNLVEAISNVLGKWIEEYRKRHTVK